MPAAEPKPAPIAPAEAERLFAPLARLSGLAIAVSGGADSTALMWLLARWRKAVTGAPRLVVLSVDHGLRAASADEARQVAGWARALGLAHGTLRWDGDKPASDIQARARAARYRLLAEACHRLGLQAIVTAHHREDQAETVLMRLARGSGVDGLSAMDMFGAVMGVALVRPLIAVPRARLAATLEAAGQPHIDDPSNDDARFARVRMRRIMAALEAEGLSAERLAATARHMRRARRALDAATDALADTAARLDAAGACAIDRLALRAAPAEIGLRLLARALMAVGGSAYRPRMERLERLYARVAGDESGRFTLAGCRIAAGADEIAIWREAGRAGLGELSLAPGESALWDGRFHVALGRGAARGLTVRALGEDGWRAVRTLRARPPVPGRVARVGVSLWAGGRLVAAPHLLPANGPQPFTAAFVGRITAGNGIDRNSMV